MDSHSTMATHKKSGSERFKGPAKYVEYLFARALVTLLQRVPIGFAYRLGRAVGWLAWVTLFRRRVIVRKNLQIVNAYVKGREICPQASEQLAMPIDAQVLEVFQRSGANLLSGFTFNKMSVEQLEKHIQIEGIENLTHALAEGKGAIILLAHMGPWEALAQLPGLAAKHDIEAPFGAMYRPLNNTYLDDWYRTQREAKGTRLLSRRDGFHKPVDFIRAGGMLGILADQKMRQGVEVEFFGVPAKTSPIPGLFRRRASDAPILSISISSLGCAVSRIKIRRVDLSNLRDRPSKETLALACNQAIEEVLFDSILDGFWFTNRFKKA